jgi:hypothetical protein
VRSQQEDFDFSLDMEPPTRLPTETDEMNIEFDNARNTTLSTLATVEDDQDNRRGTDSLADPTEGEVDIIADMAEAGKEELFIIPKE